MIKSAAPQLSKKQMALYLIPLSYVILKFNLPVFQSGHTDRMVWEYYGIGQLYVIATIVSTSLLSLALYFYGRKLKPGYTIANLYVGFIAGVTVATHYLSSLDIEVLRRIYAYSRQLRGFPLSPQKVNAIITPSSAQLVLYGLIIFFAVLFIILFFMRKRYIYSFTWPRLMAR